MDKFEGEEIVNIGDWEDALEHGEQALILSLGIGNVSLQKLVVGAELNVQQVGHIDRGFDATVPFSVNISVLCQGIAFSRGGSDQRPGTRIHTAIRPGQES